MKSPLLTSAPRFQRVVSNHAHCYFCAAFIEPSTLPVWLGGNWLKRKLCKACQEKHGLRNTGEPKEEEATFHLASMFEEVNAKLRRASNGGL